MYNAGDDAEQRLNIVYRVATPIDDNFILNVILDHVVASTAQ